MSLLIDCTAAPADFEPSQGRFRRVAGFSSGFRPAFIADFRGGAICLFRTHFLRKNIDPEQVRKLAGWGLTQNDIASFVGWSQSLVSLRFSSFDGFRRHAIKNGVEQGHGTQSNPLGMKDLWPSATRSAVTAIALF